MDRKCDNCGGSFTFSDYNKVIKIQTFGLNYEIRIEDEIFICKEG